MSTNFLFLKVCWQRPAMFCFYTSSKLPAPIISISTEGEDDGIESRLPFKIFSTLVVCSMDQTTNFEQRILKIIWPISTTFTMCLFTCYCFLLSQRKSDWLKNLRRFRIRSFRIGCCIRWIIYKWSIFSHFWQWNHWAP